MKYFREPLNGFGRHVWSLAWTSLKVKGQGYQGQKRHFFGPFGGLRVVYVGKNIFSL